MFRRKTRNAPAYTGVGLASPSAPAPDNSAMAAALTIGQNLKQARPDVYGKPHENQGSIRSGQKHTSSLLKRSSSIQGSFGATSTPRQSRTGSNLSNRHTMVPQGNSHSYSVDDSFDDSYLEQMGHEADAHYSNEAQLRDLKLHHQPQKQVKMVKKYIPTPNGITVVEVPEATMKQEIARSNSMRSGLSIRAGSLSRNNRSHSMANAARGRKQGSRLSSLVQAPRIDEQSESEYQSTEPSREHSRVLSHGSSESHELQRQIEHERQVAKDLERQRREYEQLKQLREENDRKMRELQSLQEEDPSFKDVSSLEHGNGVGRDMEDVPESHISEGHVTESQVPHAAPESVYESEEDVPVEPLPFVVDELDSKKLAEPVPEDEFAPLSTSPHDALVNSYGDTFVPLTELETTRPQESTDTFGIEEIPAESFDSPNLASQLRPTFAHEQGEESTASAATEKLEPHDSKDSETRPRAVSNISYEFGAFPEDDTRDVGPSFITVPEIIANSGPGLDEHPVDNDGLVPPPNFAGSIRSFSSLDSRSKPIKSAMKNAKPAYSSNNSSVESPARQAYLSLTTAENTRLNSKLSSSHLNETNLVPEFRPQPPKSPVNSKRMSQSLRKQPSAASQGGLAERSLRPQSVMGSQPAHPGGMGNRNLKQPQAVAPHHFVPQPIAPHPASKPNYQSPSKLRAAELYAKANKRPMSEFQTLPRKSSFSRDQATEQQQVPRRSAHRMSMRAPPAQAPAAVAPPQQNQNTHQFNSGFKSKFADSDDELDTRVGGAHANGGFSSRFADSDDEGHVTHTPSSQRQTEAPGMHTLRKKEDKKAEEPAKEKKPKKKFLRKLFGRN